ERVLELAEARAGADGNCQIGRHVFDDPAKRGRLEDEVGRPRIAEVVLGPAAAHAHRLPRLAGAPQDVGAGAGVRGTRALDGRSLVAVEAHRVACSWNSRQRLGVGKILPGLARSAGSNAVFTRRMSARSSARNCSSM